jgi:hypothetical protein
MNEKEAQNLLKPGGVYRVTVKAVELENHVTLWLPSGPIVGDKGDFLVQSITGDAEPWIVPKLLFKRVYESLLPASSIS